MGQGEDRLRTLSDEQLLAGLASVVKRRNQVTAEFLAHLAELDERRLYLDLGFASLFEYCVQALRLCESTAGRYIAAARVCRAHPQVFAWVASGELHASALSSLKKHLTSENAPELFERCRKRSARQVEELLAARFPRPDVRDLIRRLPAQTGPTPDAGRASKSAGRLPEELAAPEGAQVAPPQVPTETSQALLNARTDTSRATESAAVATRTREPTKPRRIEPLSADRYGVHFTADGEFCQLLERVRGLAAHRLPSGDLLTLLKRGLGAYERELQKERFGIGRKPRGSSSAKVASAPSVAALAMGMPVSAEPISAEPVSAELVLNEPISAEPISAEPISAEPISAEPISAERVSTEGSSTGRTSAEPTSTEPTSVESVSAEPQEPSCERTPPTSARVKRTWHCPAAVAREVFLRDGGQCSFVAADGRRCGARRRLELDHIVPRALGGDDSVRNLRLRCRAHNQQYARQCFGAARVHAAVQGSRHSLPSAVRK
ncbi:MAG TPA: HNH endonuclease domain-containing protein [Polyangiaceae bacterium]|nr:HNH endonuclease domain-containing protein [Polyangiaceae bacterium]